MHAAPALKNARAANELDTIAEDVHASNGLAGFDEAGFLRDPSDWSTELARSIARNEGIERLGDDHWRVLDFIRAYFTEFGAAPLMRRVCRESRVDRARVQRLFSSCVSAWRIAGLPHPGEEALAHMH
jgi:TusE/DsrC/DsvC family sulfur relay protein